MFIQYNNTNVHALPYLQYKTVRVKNKKTGKVKMVQKISTNQSPQDIQWLKPGWNEFPKAVWDQNKDHPQIKKMIAKGKIVVMNETVTITQAGKKVKKLVGQTDESVKLKWFDPTRAKEIVKKTLDREILQRWLDAETRSPVKRALEKQIKPLISQPKDEDEGDEDDDNSDD